MTGNTPIPPGELFQQATRHHQAGRLTQAEASYRELIGRQPDHADALHLLSLILAQAERLDEAAALMEQAVARSPGRPDMLSNRGELQRRRGQPAAAADACRRALGLAPNFP